MPWTYRHSHAYTPITDLPPYFSPFTYPRLQPFPHTCPTCRQETGFTFLQPLIKGEYIRFECQAHRCRLLAYVDLFGKLQETYHEPYAPVPENHPQPAP